MRSSSLWICLLNFFSIYIFAGLVKNGRLVFALLNKHCWRDGIKVESSFVISKARFYCTLASCPSYINIKTCLISVPNIRSVIFVNTSCLCARLVTNNKPFIKNWILVWKSTAVASSTNLPRLIINISIFKSIISSVSKFKSTWTVYPCGFCIRFQSAINGFDWRILVDVILQIKSGAFTFEG